MFEFIKSSDLNTKTKFDIKNINKNEFVLKINDNQNNLYLFYKNEIIDFIGNKELVIQAVNIIIESNILINKFVINDMSLIFINEYIKIMGGSYNNDDNYYHYKEGNIKRLLLAGGCFWCASVPYYKISGVKKIISGYAGGIEVMPKYEDVKKQKTSHRETILIIYDSNITDYKILIDSFLSSIDPFDGAGQFIDRGNSYTTAIYSSNLDIINYSKSKFKELENEFKRKIMVKILPNDILYKAEEFHQDFPIKHKKELEEELIVSGRKK